MPNQNEAALMGILHDLTALGRRNDVSINIAGVDLDGHTRATFSIQVGSRQYHSEKDTAPERFVRGLLGGTAEYEDVGQGTDNAFRQCGGEFAPGIRLWCVASRAYGEERD